MSTVVLLTLTGLGLAAPPTHDVVGVAASVPSAELRPVILAMLDGLVPLVGVRAPDERVVLDDEQLGPGYGRRSEAADEAARMLARTEGLVVDPIYTAKALAGLVARVRDGRLTGPVVFWHAGGTPGIFENLPPAG